MRESGEKSFLEEKYPDLQKSEEVESAVNRQETKTNEKIPNSPDARIGAYLSRLERAFSAHPGMLKPGLHELFVTKAEDIPESYYKHQQQIARERGHGDVEITGEMRSQMAETIVHDQAQSLDAWVDYLGSKDAPYPNWLKYFAFRSVTKLSEYDKEKKEFKKRSKGTTAPFPDINREALAYVLDSLEKSHKKEARDGATDEQWEKLLKTANFGKLYGYAIEKITPASQEDKESIQGEWVKYEQGSDAEPLYKSLQGHGTGWCTAGEGVAKTQLQAGDFHVFYSKNKKGENVPRVAIRMENGEIAEVRGIDADQNLEGTMTEVAKEKMKELPGAEKYEKKVSDMKRLTEIENKTKQGKELAKEELRFLYEMDGQIEGFGYQKDPRIEEIREARDFAEDAPIIFECRLDQIAFNKEQIKPDTVAYIGDWTPEVLSLLPKTINKDYVYEEFPEGKVFWRTIETNPDIKNVKDAINALDKEGFKTSGYAKEMLEKIGFSKEKQKYEVVSFPVKSLGFPNGAKLKDIFAKAEALGLQLCPAELGPQFRLQYKDQPEGEYIRLGMEPIIDSDGFLGVFRLPRLDGELWLFDDRGSPDGVWLAGCSFVFVRPRK